MQEMVKDWGRAWIRLSDDMSVVVAAIIEEGGYCSVHCHHSHSNSFVVVSGKLAIGIYENGVCKSAMVLEAGDGFTAQPGVYHQFYAVKPVYLMEWYVRHVPGHPASIDDIERWPGLQGGGVTETYPYKNVPHVFVGSP